MAGKENEHAVIAIYASEDAANSAIDALKSWDKANDDVKLGAIGTISKHGDKIKTHVGRKTGKGAKVGATVGVIAGVLSGGITLVGGAVAGAALGGVLGSFFKKSVGLTKEDIAQMGADLDAGRVAVVVACDENEVGPTSDQLREKGGTVRSYSMPAGTMQETAAAIDEAGAAAPEAPADESAESSDAPAESSDAPAATGDAEPQS